MIAQRGTPAAEALDGAVTALRAAGCQTPRLDAELLLADALGVARERLHSDPALHVAGPAVRQLQEAVRRRAVTREPIAYILGRRAFRDIELEVDPRALIPRPETELLVEVGLELPPGARVLDLGTGSGAIALALKHERPDLEVLASDLSADALALARANGRRLGLAVRWLQADLLEGIDTPLDAVLCNPPYVAEGERPALAPEIVRHEPAAALFAGADGLDVIRRLLDGIAAGSGGAAVPGPPGPPGAPGPLGVPALLALEVGAGQADAVAALMAGAGLACVRRIADLAGIERVLVGEARR